MLIISTTSRRDRRQWILRKYIRDIPDFPKPGILFKDITPLLADPAAFQYAIDRMAEHYPRPAGRRRGRRRGARLPVRRPAGPALQQAARCRCASRASCPTRRTRFSYDLEYGSAELHVHIDGVTAGARVLLVDDLLATGGTMEAGCQLIEKAGGQVAGCAFLVELAFLHGREKLKPHEVFSLIRY